MKGLAILVFCALIAVGISCKFVKKIRDFEQEELNSKKNQETFKLINMTYVLA